MNTEAFVRWALDDARNVEERYTTELLVEQGVGSWHSRHGSYKHTTIDETIELKRQRALNPAYQPHYTEQSVRRAAETLAELQSWHPSSGYSERFIRDIQVLRFLPQLENVHLPNTEITDVSPLLDLPRLRVLHFGSFKCEDLRPIGRCSGLRELTLKLLRHWPDMRGLEQLAEIETLSLQGNLLAFECGAAWSKVRHATLQCEPLAARNVRDLPQLPACEFLTLGGVERLDGIEAWPRLRNLTLESDVEDFAPITALRELTCFTCKAHQPVDIAPLARLPKLHFISFNTLHKVMHRPVKPRDLSPLVEAPELRELHVEGCPPLETEAVALNAALARWDDLFALSEARPVPPLRIISADHDKHPDRVDVHRRPDEPEVIDFGLRRCEGRWAARRVARAIGKKLGGSDWGEAECGKWQCKRRAVHVDIHSYGVMEKFPLIVEAIRECFARFRAEYRASVMISLKAPRPEPTPAQIELEKQFRKEQDEADFEQRERERKEYLERLHRYELKKQQGTRIDPEEFAPGERQPLPPPPWEREDEGDDDLQSGDVAVKKKPDPPPSWLDDEHPLSDQYSLYGCLTLSEFWVYPQRQDLVEYLMGRPVDEIIPNE